MKIKRKRKNKGKSSLKENRRETKEKRRHDYFFCVSRIYLTTVLNSL